MKDRHLEFFAQLQHFLERNCLSAPERFKLPRSKVETPDGHTRPRGNNTIRWITFSKICQLSREHPRKTSKKSIQRNFKDIKKLNNIVDSWVIWFWIDWKPRSWLDFQQGCRMMLVIYNTIEGLWWLVPLSPKMNPCLLAYIKHIAPIIWCHSCHSSVCLFKHNIVFT